jgi:Cytochrome P460
MKTKSVLGSCILALLAVASVAAYGQMKTTEIADAQNAGRVVDANGNLRVPVDYRTAYQFLGSWAVAADQGQGSKEVHVVYASPGTISAYRKDGRFQDGSVLVKEVFETTTGAMTTGNVSQAKILKGWFVMMRDSKNSHPDNKLWGDGGVGRGSVPPRLQKPPRQITKWIVNPAMYRRELPIGFMSKAIPR